MTRRRSHRCVAALVLVGATAFAACSSDAKVKETSDGKVAVEGSGSTSQVKISGEHGAQATYNLGKVPADFPAAVPLPKLRLDGATSAGRNGKQYFQLGYSLGGSSARTALGAYATRLGDAGFSVDSLDGPASDTTPSPLQATGKGWHVVAIATSSNGADSMIVTVDNG